MIYVIADDITGAAEIAGIAHSYGLKTLLSMSSASCVDGFDVVVVATDARSYGPEEAAKMTAEAYKSFLLASEQAGNKAGKAGGEGSDVFLFRKTDSALRGNVSEELAALGGGFVYMPANPSKGRIIRDGVYYINEQPISETDFRFDPEFPAVSSVISERFPDLEYANATCREEVDRVVEDALRNGKRLAGAADLFTSLLEQLCGEKAQKEDRKKAPSLFGGNGEKTDRLIILGSTQSKVLDLGIRIETMPYDVFYEEAAPVTWAAAIVERYRKEGSAILAIGDKEVRKGKEAAVYLRTAMAEVACALYAAHRPAEIIIEGGATAFAILGQLPYKDWQVVVEIAPGVVRLEAHDGLQVVLKPGSYPWG